MKVIELDEEENVVCPFCEQIVVNYLVSDSNEMFSPCEHTVYIACDEGFEYISPNVDLDRSKFEDPGMDFDIITDVLSSRPIEYERIKFLQCGWMNGYMGFEKKK